MLGMTVGEDFSGTFWIRFQGENCTHVRLEGKVFLKASKRYKEDQHM